MAGAFIPLLVNYVGLVLSEISSPRQPSFGQLLAAAGVTSPGGSFSPQGELGVPFEDDYDDDGFDDDEGMEEMSRMTTSKKKSAPVVLDDEADEKAAEVNLDLDD